MESVEFWRRSGLACASKPSTLLMLTRDAVEIERAQEAEIPVD